MTWRTCYALDVLRAEVNAAFPGRSKASDGTIGDAAHASRSSDHNPWVKVGSQGVVRAWDVTRDGLDLPALFERLRRMGAAGDPRLAGGGYLILDRRITTPDFSGWKAYTGSNPHTKHGHVSFSRNAAGFDSRAPWGIAAGGPAPSSSAGGPRMLELTTPMMRGDDVRELQRVLAAWYRLPATFADGVFGRDTDREVRRAQTNGRLLVDGKVGRDTRRLLGMA